MNSLRIAVLGSRGYPSTYGGFETFIRRLAPELVQRGHEITVYCRTSSEGHVARIWDADGVRCICTLGIDSKSASTLSFGLTSHLDAAVRGYDVALVLNVANGFFLPLLHARGIPAVMNTDGIEWRRGKWGPFARGTFYRSAGFSARHAHTLVSDSQALANIWRLEFGVESMYIPYGADVLTERAAHRIRDLDLSPESYALVVARLTPENNVDLTLDALAHLHDVPVVVVGSANYTSPLESRLRSLAQHGALLWLGHVADQELLTQLWANAGVYVHGHSVGGTNPALLQALGAGAPTLALDTPFNREVLERPSMLYPASASTLARRIQAVLASDAMRNDMRMHGQEVIHSRYRWDSVISAYAAALGTAAASR